MAKKAADPDHLLLRCPHCKGVMLSGLVERGESQIHVSNSRITCSLCGQGFGFNTEDLFKPGAVPEPEVPDEEGE